MAIEKAGRVPAFFVGESAIGKSAMRNRALWVCALALLTASGIRAEEEVLLRSADGRQQVTAEDFRADALALPDHVRYHALSEPLKVEAVGQGLLVRSILAKQAREKGLDQREIIKIRLQQVQDAALRDFLLEDLFKEKSPSDADLLKYAENEYKYNAKRFQLPAKERKASHILITGTDEDAKKSIDDLHHQLQQGADFGELAFKFSKDPGSASNYGSLGYFPKGKMVPEFESELDKLEKHGEYSKPFQTQFGWHIVRLDDTRDAGLVPFEQVRQRLIEEGREKAFKDFRETLFQKTLAQVKSESAAIEAFAKKNKELADKQRAK
ncbi:peptidylprolyl isomerase [Allofranklinella schreckenbergeri]|uniref:peptidylprolyl isomerase n=1 Tax=Allofranklinella schreckenbergeri TaxID=1076744 RepID=UPI001EED6CDE|nr:peptidylprolyl isomerase [Allofranklinella schreckenbergeri]